MNKIGKFKLKPKKEFVRDTIRLNPKKLIEGKSIHNGLLDDSYADKIAKKAKWWGKGKIKQGIGYYDAADMSKVMYDEKGPYVVNLKQNETFKPNPLNRNDSKCSSLKSQLEAQKAKLAKIKSECGGNISCQGEKGIDTVQETISVLNEQIASNQC